MLSRQTIQQHDVKAVGLKLAYNQVIQLIEHSLKFESKKIQAIKSTLQDLINEGTKNLEKSILIEQPVQKDLLAGNVTDGVILDIL